MDTTSSTQSMIHNANMYVYRLKRAKVRTSQKDVLSPHDHM